LRVNATLNPKLSIGLNNFALRADESPLKQSALSGLNPDTENEKDFTTLKQSMSFIFSRQHKVQKSQMTFLG
jgi:hypothetical protein